MKNLFLLPTNKPSKLYKEDNVYKLDNLVYGAGKQNIYITSDEEIKEGEWYKSGKFIWQMKYPQWGEEGQGEAKKIILTTDQDLIKAGVQSIPDEFLEWFVKNPSCESVDVRKTCCGQCDERLCDVYDTNIGWTKENTLYEIAIPKEEPKQCDICKMSPRLEGTNKCESCYSVVRHFLEQNPRFKDNLLPDLRKKQETSSVGAENQIFKIVLDEKWRPKKVSIIETDNNSVLNKQETLEKITEQIQNECHIFVESVTNVTYQDATNTFLFMKLAELTLKLKKYE